MAIPMHSLEILKNKSRCRMFLMVFAGGGIRAAAKKERPGVDGEGHGGAQRSRHRQDARRDQVRYKL